MGHSIVLVIFFHDNLFFSIVFQRSINRVSSDITNVSNYSLEWPEQRILVLLQVLIRTRK
ncbi:hypothetical protein M413DRAFT_277429 [Hebeloma cylindrosporum]|uniref:Uncharacterized protein n=1 Tax=Hebeloma cylindrosporum TaxID=76867 RepID=A0A0C3BZ54_HEBCY|nr:hypothetical protein M413DRAFT_277429 [Hebeloma cylindrosporum h7]